MHHTKIDVAQTVAQTVDLLLSLLDSPSVDPDHRNAIVNQLHGWVASGALSAEQRDRVTDRLAIEADAARRRPIFF